MRHADLLAGRAHIEATLPVQPMRTRLRSPIGPAVPAVKLRDQHQPAMLGSIEMTGKLGDLRAQLRHREGRRSGKGICIHERSLNTSTGYLYSILRPRLRSAMALRGFAISSYPTRSNTRC